MNDSNVTSYGPQTYRFFPQQRRLDVLGGGEGFRSRPFQIETLYRKKGLIKKSQPVKSERCLC